LLALLGRSCIDSFRPDDVEVKKDVESARVGLFVGGSGMGMEWGQLDVALDEKGGRQWSLEVETRD
jgi:hypothetical protein